MQTAVGMAVLVLAAHVPTPWPQEAPGHSPAELRGRFLLPDGAPAQGVCLEVAPFPSSERRYGRTAPADSLRGTSGTDGRFAVRFDPHAGCGFTLEAALPGYCKVAWSWVDIGPGKQVDVGEVQLQRGGSVRGRILDVRGRVLTTGWIACGMESVRRPYGEPVPVRVMSPPDSATGEFLLEGLPEGKVRLGAKTVSDRMNQGPEVEVRAGKEARADIVYREPDLGSCIVIRTLCEPFHSFSHDVVGVAVRGPGSPNGRNPPAANSSPVHIVGELDPGEYTVEIRDPRFLPWSKSGVRPGSGIEAVLKGNASMALSVIDDASDERLPHYAVDIRFDNPDFVFTTFRILEPAQDPPRDGVFDGLVPHDQTLFVLAQGYAPCEVPLPGLAANERRTVVARLTRGRSVRGTVVQGSRRLGRAGAEVKLVPMSMRAPWEFGAAEDLRRRTVETTSDAKGGFSFACVAVGEYELKAKVDKGFLAGAYIYVAPESDPKAVEIVLPAPARLVGKIVAPAGASLVGANVLVVPPGWDDGANGGGEGIFPRPPISASVAPDGTFQSATVPAGSVRVTLHVPGMDIEGLDSMRGHGVWVGLGSVELEAEVDTHKEFDVRSTFPVFLPTTVRLNGKPEPELLVRLQSRFGMVPTIAIAVTDAAGVAHVGPLDRGPYNLLVQPRDASWIYVDPREIHVQSNRDGVGVDFELHAGSLMCLNATDKSPIADQLIWLSPYVGKQWNMVSAKTDAKGSVRLSLPAGTWCISIDPHGAFLMPKQGVSIEWSTKGPSVDVVELNVGPRR